jgi:tRNA/tmRNA/rRNA uracil-C5-methylase (TrmA/RlmC/RlmD family)
MSKLTYLFGAHYEQWKYSEPYLSFITPEIIANTVIHEAGDYFSGLVDKVVWDMFAGIGTDAIRLARVSGKVICTELNKATFKDLQHNVKVMEQHNMKLLNGDCVDYMSSIECDIIYFDPPWGDTFQSGMDFDFSNIILDNGKSVIDLVLAAQRKSNLIIKSPFSSNSFESVFDPVDIIGVYAFRQQKLKFIFVLRKET